MLHTINMMNTSSLAIQRILFLVRYGKHATILVMKGSTHSSLLLDRNTWPSSNSNLNNLPEQKASYPNWTVNTQWHQALRPVRIIPRIPWPGRDCSPHPHLSDREALRLKWGEMNEEGLQYAKGQRVYGGGWWGSDHPAWLPQAWL